MSFDHTSAQELLVSIFRNISVNQISELGTPQSLLLQILSTAIEDPKSLTSGFTTSINDAAKLFNGKEEEDKLARKSQLIFLTLENILFNVYSKLKTSETVSLQDSLYHTQASISYSILNLDSSRQVLQHTKFTAFMQTLIGSQNFYEDLLKLIPKTTKQQNSQLVAMHVKNLISTLDYITEKEAIKSDVFATKRNKFLQYLRIAPEKAPIKENIRRINKVIFSGNITRIRKLISIQKDRQLFELSLLRVYHYYRRNVTNPKYFESNAINGQESFQRCLTTYVNSKANGSKDTLFRENRSAEPLFDLIVSYMTFYFLPIARIFDDYSDKYLLPFANLDTAGFYSNFIVQGLQQAKQILETLALEFKDFLRKVYYAINAAGFSDKLPSTAPIKTLVFHRFFFSPEIRALLHKKSSSSTKKSDDYLKVSNYFKDLFYEASLKKYSYIPEFTQAYDILNGLFEDILTKKKAFKGEVQIPNYLRFYITKPLLRLDYTILKQGIDHEGGGNEYSEEFEDSFYDEKLEQNYENQPQTNAISYKNPNLETPNILQTGDKSSNKVLKKIFDGDEDFSGSIDEEFLHVVDKGFVKEEPRNIIQPRETAFKTDWKEELGDHEDFNFEKRPQTKEPESTYNKEEREAERDRRLSTGIKEKLTIYQDENQNNANIAAFERGIKEVRSQGASRIEGRTEDEESWIEKFEKESEMKIKMAEMEHNKEKTILMNRLGLLEEKYAMAMDTFGNVRNKGQEEKIREDNEVALSQVESIDKRKKHRKKNKEDDEFYKLHQEIMQDREKALDAELVYIMHKRTNFPGGF